MSVPGISSTHHNQQVMEVTQGWGPWLASFIITPETATDLTEKVVQSLTYVYESRDALIAELKDFPNAPEEIATEALDAFIKAHNKAFPFNPINPSKDLVEEVRRVKQEFQEEIDDFELVEPEPDVTVTVTAGFQDRIANPTKLEDDLAAIRKELAPFYDHPETLTHDDIMEYVGLLNTTYPEYAINPDKPLVDEIRCTKMAMIERGEEGFKKGVNWYAFFSQDAMDTMVKISTYQKDRAGFAEDINYQQRMLSSFKFFYG